MKNDRRMGEGYRIEGFDRLPPFSSFLPGLAGIKGIPMWVFYTNRGQGINSFGIHNKNNAIMEFNPANTAYENTSLKGYRTFIKSNGQYYEPFSALEREAKRSLSIHKNSIMLEETNLTYGIKITVSYYVLPEDRIGALVRRVQLENIGSETKALELLDGLPKIIPYGIKNSGYKEMSNLLKSWTELKNIDKGAPFYTLRASSDDSAEVSEIEGGYFYVGIMEGQVQPVIYDPDAVFSYETSLIQPVTFMKQTFSELLNYEQSYYNKIPCGFSLCSLSLEPGERKEFYSLSGFSASPQLLNERVKEFCGNEYLAEKEIRADMLVSELTKDIRTRTAIPVFDQYMEQNYLDNFLRGGYPFVINKGTNKAVVHLFSRKHGDPERDYNFFSIAGEYYSQGNGNFRDVNQNRRNDVFFHRDIGDFNIRTFFSLIQMDGYNPLEVRPSTFRIKPELYPQAEKLIHENIGQQAERMLRLIQKDFTPGQVANFIAANHLEVEGGEDLFLESLLNYCEQNIEAGFGEGYWSDHWDYNMDLIDSYLNIYPDKEVELLFTEHSYRYYDSPARVLPRSEKYVLNKNHEVRQYGAIVHDEEKLNQPGFQKNGTNWLRTKDGNYVTTSLMGKLIVLALCKFSSLDAFGMGIEMEGGKPGWNDAMNGLPGLFGSGMTETFELKRLITFICRTACKADNVLLPQEVYLFLTKVNEALTRSSIEKWSDFTYWDRVTTLRENYREQVRFTTSGVYQRIDTKVLNEIFLEFADKLDRGIQKACTFGTDIVPTYFTFRAREFEMVEDEKGQPVISHYGLPKAKVSAFEAEPLPLFLEAPTKMLANMQGIEEAEALYHRVKDSQLFDRKLGMYKTCVPIEHISMECGRIRAFTPGWLERESVFLHMEYKYLLAILRAGLYEHFYNDIKSAMVVFRDPAEYGRSILENSSFLASSVNPDPSVHGRGYVARLSGSTTEVITMWIEMFLGNKLFTYNDGELQLHFNPKLPGWLFDQQGTLSFTLLSCCNITYHNPSRKDTYGNDGAKISKIVILDSDETVYGNCLSGALARKVRQGEIKEILVELE